MLNAANGNVFNRLAYEVMGYTHENGWAPEYENSDIAPGRRWDFAHVVYDEFGDIDPDETELVENKSGRLDGSQLAADERALQLGYKVTYNLGSDLSPGDLNKLIRLKNLYRDQFDYRWIPAP